FVFNDGPAEPAAGIAADKEWTRRGWAADQVRIRRHVVIAIEEVRAAVKVVAASAGHHVDRAAGGDRSRQIEIHRGNLKFLDHFLGEIHGRNTAADIDIIGNVSAIDGKYRPVS